MANPLKKKKSWFSKNWFPLFTLALGIFAQWRSCEQTKSSSQYNNSQIDLIKKHDSDTKRYNDSVLSLMQKNIDSSSVANSMQLNMANESLEKTSELYHDLNDPGIKIFDVLIDSNLNRGNISYRNYGKTWAKRLNFRCCIVPNIDTMVIPDSKPNDKAMLLAPEEINEVHGALPTGFFDPIINQTNSFYLDVKMWYENQNGQKFIYQDIHKFNYKLKIFELKSSFIRKLK